MYPLDDDRQWRTAVDRAGAHDVVAATASGLATQLVPTWPDGVELVGSGSGRSSRSRAGSCASGRCSLILDEPRRARRRNGARAVRALRIGRARRRRRRPHHDSGVAPLLHRRMADSDRRADGRAPCRNRHARGTDGKAGQSRSCTDPGRGVQVTYFRRAMSPAEVFRIGARNVIGLHRDA